MDRIRKLGFLLFIGLCVPATAIAQGGFVEGTVFDKRTGTPLENALVTVTSSDGVCTADLGGECTVPVVGQQVLTDGNGFYSIEISEERLHELMRAGLLGRMRAVAICARRGKTHSSDKNPHPIHPNSGVEVRNLYVTLAGRRNVVCDNPLAVPVPEGFLLQLPPCDSLPPAEPGEAARACRGS
jgi:hypothetical protein